MLKKLKFAVQSLTKCLRLGLIRKLPSTKLFRQLPSSLKHTALVLLKPEFIVHSAEIKVKSIAHKTSIK